MYFRNTVLALGSFLDTFQKIADAASNTKGETPFLGAKLLLRKLMRVLMSVDMSHGIDVFVELTKWSVCLQQRGRYGPRIESSCY